MVYTTRKNEKFELRAYTNVDQVGNIDEIKNTSRGTFYLGKRLVTWTSKKEKCISETTAEAEYVATTINCTNIVWIKQLLKGMKEEVTEPMILYCYNMFYKYIK